MSDPTRSSARLSIKREANQERTPAPPPDPPHSFQRPRDPSPEPDSDEAVGLRLDMVVQRNLAKEKRERAAEAQRLRRQEEKAKEEKRAEVERQRRAEQQRVEKLAVQKRQAEKNRAEFLEEEKQRAAEEEKAARKKEEEKKRAASALKAKLEKQAQDAARKLAGDKEKAAKDKETIRLYLESIDTAPKATAKVAAPRAAAAPKATVTASPKASAAPRAKATPATKATAAPKAAASPKRARAPVATTPAALRQPDVVATLPIAAPAQSPAYYDYAPSSESDDEHQSWGPSLTRQQRPVPPVPTVPAAAVPVAGADLSAAQLIRNRNLLVTQRNAESVTRPMRERAENQARALAQSQPGKEREHILRLQQKDAEHFAARHNIGYDKAVLIMRDMIGPPTAPQADAGTGKGKQPLHATGGPSTMAIAKALAPAVTPTIPVPGAVQTPQNQAIMASQSQLNMSLEGINQQLNAILQQSRSGPDDALTAALRQAKETAAAAALLHSPTNADHFYDDMEEWEDPADFQAHQEGLQVGVPGTSSAAGTSGNHVGTNAPPPAKARKPNDAAQARDAADYAWGVKNRTTAQRIMADIDDNTPPPESGAHAYREGMFLCPSDLEYLWGKDKSQYVTDYLRAFGHGAYVQAVHIRAPFQDGQAMVVCAKVFTDPDTAATRTQPGNETRRTQENTTTAATAKVAEAVIEGHRRATPTGVIDPHHGPEFNVQYVIRSNDDTRHYMNTAETQERVGIVAYNSYALGKPGPVAIAITANTLPVSIWQNHFSQAEVRANKWTDFTPQAGVAVLAEVGRTKPPRGSITHASSGEARTLESGTNKKEKATWASAAPSELQTEKRRLGEPGFIKPDQGIDILHKVGPTHTARRVKDRTFDALTLAVLAEEDHQHKLQELNKLQVTTGTERSLNSDEYTQQVAQYMSYKAFLAFLTSQKLPWQQIVTRAKRIIELAAKAAQESQEDEAATGGAVESTLAHAEAVLEDIAAICLWVNTKVHYDLEGALSGAQSARQAEEQLAAYWSEIALPAIYSCVRHHQMELANLAGDAGLHHLGKDETPYKVVKKTVAARIPDAVSTRLSRVLALKMSGGTVFPVRKKGKQPPSAAGEPIPPTSPTKKRDKPEPKSHVWACGNCQSDDHMWRLCPNSKFCKSKGGPSKVTITEAQWKTAQAHYDANHGAGKAHADKPEWYRTKHVTRA